ASPGWPWPGRSASASVWPSPPPSASAASSARSASEPSPHVRSLRQPRLLNVEEQRSPTTAGVGQSPTLWRSPAEAGRGRRSRPETQAGGGGGAAQKQEPPGGTSGNPQLAR